MECRLCKWLVVVVVVARRVSQRPGTGQVCRGRDVPFVCLLARSLRSPAQKRTEAATGSSWSGRVSRSGTGRCDHHAIGSLAQLINWRPLARRLGNKAPSLCRAAQSASGRRRATSFVSFNLSRAGRPLTKPASQPGEPAHKWH